MRSGISSPWDPSPEAELWLQGLGQTYGVKPIWDGLVTVEQLAAKYGDVVDYYLHGGREKIEEIYTQVAALFAVGQSGEGRDVPRVSTRVQKALGTLDHDPHYRYEHRFGEGTLPPLGDRPGLVLSWMVAEKTGCWTVVDVIARCAASTQEAHHGRGSPPFSREAPPRRRTDFVTYGAPFTSPVGAFHGEMDAPGGLGGSLEGATMFIGSVLTPGKTRSSTWR